VSLERQPGASLAKGENGHGIFLGVSSVEMASLHLLSLTTFWNTHESPVMVHEVCIRQLIVRLRV
jgi:hypothetical protein